MEFREYWLIIWRRRHLVVPLVALTFIASALFNLALPPVYKTDTTVYVQAIIPPAPPGTPQYYSTEYYNTVYSEYLADDLSVIVQGGAFAQRIADEIEQRYGQRLEPKEVQDAIAQTKRLHRTLKITVATGNEERTRRLSEALDDVLRNEGTRYFTTSDGQQLAQVQVIDPPREPRAPSLVRRLLEVLLHTAVAFVVAVGLAFFLHYIDDRIQDEEDAARTLGLPVLGAVPAEPGTAPPPSLPALVWAGLLPRGWRKSQAA